jgi:hypothetical protein
MKSTFIVPVPKNFSNFEKSFCISKEKFKRIIQDKTFGQIIDLGKDFFKDFMVSHVAYISYMTNKNVRSIVESLREDFKENEDTLITLSGDKLKEYKDLDSCEIDFYFSMYMFGIWQKYVLCRLVLPGDFYIAKNLGIVMNAYSREGLMKVVRAIASRNLVVGGEQGEFLII